MENLEIFNPFGTLIIKTKVPDNLFNHVLELVNYVKPSLNDNEFLKSASFDEYLAGKNSYQIRLPDNFFEKTGLGTYLIDLSKIYVNKFNYPNDRLITGNSWLNFTYRGDFNSMHSHDSLLSGIIYVHQDKEIFEEASLVDNDRHIGSVPGTTNFIVDLNLNKPFYNPFYINHFKSQELILFPSWLNHFVNPFKSDSERITLAFNIVEK